MKENISNIINILEDYIKINKRGFLPNKTPIYNLPKPYNIIVDATSKLPSNYHGEDKNSRIWIDEIFKIFPLENIDTLENLNNHQLESLMTKISLLGHAYRWKNMPACASEYKRKKIVLPENLNTLWKAIAKKLNTPMVGTFYTMISNNWYHKDIKENQEYTFKDINEKDIDILHSWLLPPEHEQLRSFVIAALGIEAQGELILKGAHKIYLGIYKENINLLNEGLSNLEESLDNIIYFFNKSIKLKLIQSTSFLTYIQPTMIWLIDDIEGANGTQSCSIQAIDSILGVKRNTKIGKMLTRSREYLLPEHLNLLNSLDNYSNILFDFIKSSKNIELTNKYNSCVKKLNIWRNSHKNRGAKYLKKEKENPIEHYTSTGLAVSDTKDRDEVFKELMESHILETKNNLIAKNEKSL